MTKKIFIGIYVLGLLLVCASIIIQFFEEKSHVQNTLVALTEHINNSAEQEGIFLVENQNFYESIQKNYLFHPYIKAAVFYAENRQVYYIYNSGNVLFLEKLDWDNVNSIGFPEPNWLLQQKSTHVQLDGLSFHFSVYLQAFSVTDIQRRLGTGFAAITLISLIFISIILLYGKRENKVGFEKVSGEKSAEDIKDENEDNAEIGEDTDSAISDNVHIDNKPSLYNPESGFVWQDFLIEKLDHELDRSASFDQDLVLGLLNVGLIDKENTYNKIQDLIADYFSYPDLIFDYDDNNICFILPNTDIFNGSRIFEEFLKRYLALHCEKNIYCGISSRNGRLLSGKRLLFEAERALNKAFESKHSDVVTFYTDPVQYRSYLANKTS